LTFDIEKNTATLKSSSGVTEGHRRWYHSITWLWLLISVIRPIVVTLSLICTVIYHFWSMRFEKYEYPDLETRIRD